MTQFDFKFEEVALSLGKGKDGKQQNIALITGTAVINVVGRRREIEWEIESITLEGPILHDPDVEIEYSHPLYKFVVASIEGQCGDSIWNEANDASMPDPDAAYDRMRDERMERV